MFPYIFVILVLFFGALLEITIADKKNLKIYFLFESLLILLLVGLRFHTGADWYAYEYAFYKGPELGNWHNWELGYHLLSLLCNKIFGNYYAFQFLISLFVVFSTSKFVWKYAEYPLTSLFLFFIMFVPNGILMCTMRQSIALAIILFGTKYILNRSFIKFIIIVYIASLFHISSIAALPLYFCTYKIAKSNLIIAILIAQVFYFFPKLIAHFVRLIIPILPGRLEDIAQSYMNDILFSGTVSFGTGYYYICSIIISIVLILLINRKNETHNLYVNALTITTIISALSNSLSILNRFEPTYLIFGLLAYPLVFNIKIKHIKKTVVPIVALVLLGLFYYIPFNALLTSTSISSLSGRPESYGWTPYYNVLFHPAEAEKRLDWNEKEK